MKRITFSLQMSKVSASLLPPSSKVAATETVQPLSFGSLTVARPWDASGFESLVVSRPAEMTTLVAVVALVLIIITARDGAFGFSGLRPLQAQHQFDQFLLAQTLKIAAAHLTRESAKSAPGKRPCELASARARRHAQTSCTPWVITASPSNHRRQNVRHISAGA
ncbi:hypothetical protein [Methylobacterium frigidaeris]|uniref:hypothetical protein n=1 Tax=Methylobacterium frigidaeris TaxID=2038277 RepID=UPI001EDDDE04|nr:hypothetical protein [Methylobacterium frigidaeris]